MSSVFQCEAASGRSWYSLSYLYFCLLGTLTTMVVGLLVSMATGGCKQDEKNPDLFVKASDLFSFSCCGKSKVSEVTEKSATDFNTVADNPTFTDFEMKIIDPERATKL
ncbi:hypothetical protein F7725_017365 [Dissostichus mawsoni]|uniref:Uncharacterized protein n=1 Tax=Dissostichus mawsoni TaxID=36200 RepID=A0A7J5Z482_DISMA|nr:hypothetical protein F7725_017365 [Dissostichus mawsoni]